ncbi:MAG: hypothetical protein WCK29_00830, partial [archaeon]
MKKVNKFYLGFAFLLFLGLMGFVGADTFSYGGYSSSSLGTSTSYTNYYSSQNIASLWPSIQDAQSCVNRQDMLLQVAPAGCQPTVVRSDLIAQQTVPVLCQLTALQTNPLVDIKSIRNIAFTGKYPDTIQGIVFHPSRAALNTGNTLFGDPIINNVGYVVVLLKKNANESSLPESVSVNLTARIEYQNGNAFGIGNYEFILPEQSDADWQLNKDRQSFLKGNYFVKLEQADASYALISIYNGDLKVATTRVNYGSSSSDVYLPGFYCQSALTIQYTGYESAQQSARIEVSDEKGTETFDVYKGSKVGTSGCRVSNIIMNSDQSGSVSLSCPTGPMTLQIKTVSQFATNQEVNYVNTDGTLTKATIIGFSNGMYQINLAGNPLNVTASQLRATNSTAKDSTLSADAQAYFDEAIKYYEQTAREYPNDKEKKDDSQYIGEVALYKGVELARTFGKGATQYRLLNQLVNNYSMSNSIAQYRRELAQITQSDQSLAGKTIFVNNGYVNLRLVQLDQPSKQSSASFDFVRLADKTKKVDQANYPQVTLNYGDKSTALSQEKDSNIEYFRISSVDVNGATLAVKCKGDSSETSVGPIRSVDYGQTTYNAQIYNQNINTPQVTICKNNYKVTVSNINTQKVARIRILPAAQQSRAETNLSVSIGIEKRAIKLNPEKTNDTIANLNASIDKWNQISTKLGNTVTALKGACLATTAILTVKNFFSGLDGTALARQKAMQDYGWDSRCKAAVSAKTVIPGDSISTPYKNVDECFARNQGAIDKTIEAIKNKVNSDNTKIDASLKDPANIQSDTLLGGKRANTDAVAKAYISDLKNSLGTSTLQVSDPNNPSNNIIVGNVISTLTDSDYGNGTIGYEQAKKISLSAQLAGDSSVDAQTRTQARSDLYTQLNQIQTSKANLQQTQLAVSNSAGLFKTGSNLPFTNGANDPKSIKGYYYGQTGSSLNSNIYILDQHLGDANFPINSGDKIAPITANGNNYIVVLGSASGTESDCYLPRTGATALYRQNGNELIAVDSALASSTAKQVNTNGQDEYANVMSKFSCFKKTDASSYMHKYLNAEVRYYEVEPYKGVPEVVPVDLNEGWYAGIKQESGLLGNKKSVDASGAVQSFWLCNVGSNGKEEFEQSGFGDDTCKRFDFYTGQVLSDFPGITDKSKVTALVNKAVSALKDAQRSYASGVKNVNVAGNNVKVGNPAVLINGANCADFMSASDCSIMFNLCDPVICPNSRCDLGGTFQVQDVIQSGIVGSAVLCLPNFGNPQNGGVVIPVCLSGLKAGIDGFVSILKSHRDCLQTSLSTGQMVGICDQIYSIYMCDFFWKQIAPAFDSLIPKIVELASGKGQSARGGGEYMTTMYAWENAKKSVEYFTQSYAVNSFKAFQSRSAEEIGGQFCKAFASTSTPSAVKSLLEPDSPVQFYAQFDSQTYSTATIPATAQYNVFYHIFAGNDAGVYYNVYLKDGPSTSYYASTGSVPVATGFIAKGQTADETKVFTAPEGYKQLCVRINNEEKCGFKQVTTSFAVNYLKDQLVSSQLNQTAISTEAGCISGSGAANGDLNALGLLNTNLQAGAQNAISGNVYENGIVRVCATDNPASSTNPSRYVQVGICGDTKIKCWLDKNSVTNSLEAGDSGLRNATLQSLSDSVATSAQIKLELTKSYNSIINIKINVTKLIAEISGKSSRDVDFNAVNSLITQIDNLLNNIPDNSQTTNASSGEIVLLNSQKAQLISLKGQLKDAVARSYYNSYSASAGARATAGTSSSSVGGVNLICDTTYDGTTYSKGNDGNWYNGSDSDSMVSDSSFIVLLENQECSTGTTQTSTGATTGTTTDLNVQSTSTILANSLDTLCFLDRTGGIDLETSYEGGSGPVASGLAVSSLVAANTQEASNAIKGAGELVVQDGSKVINLESYLSENIAKIAGNSITDPSVVAERAIVKSFPGKNIYNLVIDPVDNKIIGQVTSLGQIRQVSKATANSIGMDVIGSTGSRILKGGPTVASDSKLILKSTGETIGTVGETTILSASGVLKYIPKGTIVSGLRIAGKFLAGYGLVCDTWTIGVTAVMGYQTTSAIIDAQNSANQLDAFYQKLVVNENQKISSLENYIALIQSGADTLSSEGYTLPDSLSKDINNLNNFVQDAKKANNDLNNFYQDKLTNAETESSGLGVTNKITSQESKDILARWDLLNKQLNSMGNSAKLMSNELDNYYYSGDYNFDSYKLDSVSAYFICDKVQKLEHGDNLTRIYSKNLKGLE